MRGCFLGLLKLLANIGNLLLAAVFLGMAVIGGLLRNNSDLVIKVFGKIHMGHQKEVILEYLKTVNGPIGIGMIVIGAVVGALCLLVFFASCCNCCGCLLKTYNILLALVIVAEFIAIGVVFGKPAYLEDAAYKVMEKVAPSYGTNSGVGNFSTVFWDMLTAPKTPPETNPDEDNEHPAHGVMSSEPRGICCGVNNYTDFGKALVLPPACCGYSTLEACDVENAAAAVRKVQNCKTKIDKVIADEKNNYLITCMIGIAVQVAMLLFAGISVCAGRRRRY